MQRTPPPTPCEIYLFKDKHLKVEIHELSLPTTCCCISSRKLHQFKIGQILALY